MGIFDDLNSMKCNRSILHLTMLTSLVAATATATMTPNTSKDKSASENVIDQKFQAPRIPFCDDNYERTVGRRLLYITTLDGRLTALDIIKSGKLRWSIPTGPGGLISSSIHRLELTNNGQFVRMIPSLSGGIYKFDGESIDPIPITTEHLLSSSAKFSDDLVISGGKETRTYGVSARTGQLLYECSMNGCINSTDTDSSNATDQIVKSMDGNDRDDFQMPEHDPLLDDVIVVRRQTQTVRAIESRTGNERWNFSVGQHELDLLKPSECHDRQISDIDLALLDIDIKVIVPEGIVCAFSKSQNGLMLWKYKFDHPIVSGWKNGPDDNLENIDLFGPAAQWLWSNDDNGFDLPNPAISPSIYLGMYDKQLYIQESIRIRKEILDQSSLYNQLATVEPHMPKIPWRPITASSNALIIFREDRAIQSGTIPSNNNNNNNIFVQGNELVPYDEDNFALSAQSVLNASEYVNGNGFYLYTDADLNKTKTDSEPLCNDKDKPITDNESNVNTEELLNLTRRSIDEDLGFSLDDIDAPIKVVVLSLWFWWKEIVVIALTSAILLNFLMNQRMTNEREIVVIERHIPVPTGIEATESSTNAMLVPVTNGSSGTKSTSLGQRSISESTSNSGDNYLSRFQCEFDLVSCLGRGGFGVVFEAKNKLDDCKYAIKRITLPNKEESRNRVLREARTLASCEHQNIVRYFHSWVETPPSGWQEQEDNKLLALEMSTSIQIETPDGTTLPSLPSNNHKSSHRDNKLVNGQQYYKDKKKQMLSWISSVATSTACSSDPECDHNNHLDEDDDDDDCSIVFRSESQSMAMKDQDDDKENEENFYKKNNKALPSDAVSIDIHSNSFDLNINKTSNRFKYSELSDSFQIEFVRSAADGYTNSSAEIQTSNDMSLQRRKNKQRRPSNLDLFTNHNNNITEELSKEINGLNGAVALPAPPLQGSSTNLTPPKPNKMYLYIQMQLCRKESLRDWLRDNKTEARLSHISSIFHQIVDAVDYVHLKGLIHRDLKPSNIFFSQDGQVKIGDFGLVTDMSDIPNMVTKCGDKSGLPSCARHTQQVGTHLYMSPEQLKGQHYDHKVDIYSLGLIFFELHAYFVTEMERIKTMRDLRDGKYPEQFCLEYPAEHKLLQQMLANDPAERPQIKELKQQLNQILKIPDFLVDNEALAAAARRLSRSRTFSSCE